jgi:DNA-binding transcriptional LysR family regulator
MPQLDLPALKAFVAVADTGSITAAAERVARSQAAVSMQINKLERGLGKPLLARLPRGVALTEAGEQLLGYARRMVRLEYEALGAVRQPRLKGTVRIGTPDDYAHCFLPGVLARFAEVEPEVAVEVHCQDSAALYEQLRRGQLDVALVTHTAAGGGGEIVHTEPVVFATVAGADLHRRSPMPLALWLPGCPVRALALRALDTAGIDYRVAYTSPSNAGLQAAVLSGLAVGVMARSTLTPDMVVLDQRHGLPAAGEIQLELLQRDSGRDTLVGSLCEHIRDCFQNRHGLVASPWRLTG